MAPTRVLVAAVPDWPAVAAGCPAGVPAAVVAANRVLAATPAARVEGVRPGQRRREAQSRCPQLSVVGADAGREARGWEPVVAAVESLAPGVEVLAPGALALATRGPSRYFGGDEALGETVAATVDMVLGREVCVVGVADGLFAARLAAGGGDETGRGGPDRVTCAAWPDRVTVVAPGRSREWLAPQPVGLLGADHADLAGLLARLGIATLGDLAALPAPSVLGRFGSSGAAARRLAGGLDERPVLARTPPPDLAAAAEMDPPEARVETAAFVAKALADDLHRRLGAAGLVCTKVAIEVETEHGDRLVRHWRHDGALTPAALSERARWQLEGWMAGGCPGGGGPSGPGGGRPSGGLTMLRLTPEEVRPDGGLQLGFWGGQADSDSDARAGRALARVQGLLGPDAVATAVRAGGRGFAEQVRLVPWGDRRAPGPAAPGPAAPWPGRLDRPSPAVVHAPPRPAAVRDAAGEPVAVTGRGTLSAAPSAVSVDGGPWSAVVAWAGPWPLEERWWDSGGRRRARLQIVLEGGEAHGVTRESGSWWVEATYS